MSNFISKNKSNIEKFIEFTNNIKGSEDYKKYNLELCANFLEDMTTKLSIGPFGFDEACKFNIKHIGENFARTIEDTSYSTKTFETVIIFLIRIGKEYELNSDTLLPESGSTLLEIYSKQSDNYTKELNAQIYYTFNKMPFQIMKFDNSLKFGTIKKDFKSDIKKILKDELPQEKEEIDKLKTFIENAKKVLEEQKQKFSFVLLNNAFSELEKNKILSKNITLGLLIVLAFIIVFIPYYYYSQLFLIKEITVAFELLFKAENVAEPKKTLPIVIMLSGMIPMFLIETICIYFFRIVLHKYNSLVDQIIQLETKQAIVQFIESYVDYKKDKNLTHEELAKFEDIVFSKISPNLKDVPDVPNIITLVEGIAKAVKAK